MNSPDSLSGTSWSDSHEVKVTDLIADDYDEMLESSQSVASLVQIASDALALSDSSHKLQGIEDDISSSWSELEATTTPDGEKSKQLPPF